MGASTNDKKTLRWMFIVVGFVVVLAIAAIVWLRVNNTLPVVNIPTPVIPSPNAYDYYVDAGNAIVDSKKIGFAVSPASSGHVYTWTEKESLVAQNARSLDFLRKGFQYECRNPPARSMGALFPHLAKWRALARLLELQAQVKAAKGDNAGAMASCLDCVQFGTTCPRGGVIIHDLPGTTVQAIGRTEAWNLVDKLNSDEASAAAHKVKTILSRQTPFADVLTEEKWATTATMIQLFSNKAQLSVLNGAAASAPTLEQIWGQIVFGTMNKGTVVNNYMRYMDQLAGKAKSPYASRLPAPMVPRDPVNSILVPVYDGARFRHVFDADTQNSLLAVTLALRAYRLEHGRYPITLRDLAPRYLKTVPNDPFALSGPLHYRNTGASYLLYSIGPDGKDDGGTPVTSATRTSNISYKVDEGSKGDIVAGVNK